MAQRWTGIGATPTMRAASAASVPFEPPRERLRDCCHRSRRTQPALQTIGISTKLSTEPIDPNYAVIHATIPRDSFQLRLGRASHRGRNNPTAVEWMGVLTGIGGQQLGNLARRRGQ